MTKIKIRHLLLIFSAMLSNSLAAQVVSWPSYREVVAHYFSNYLEPEANDEGWRLYFSRRPDGYYAEQSIYFANPDAVELLYDFEAHAYRELSDQFKRRPSDPVSSDEHAQITQRRVENFIAQQYNLGQFDELPYFGYPGWYKDVIALYEKAGRPLTAWEWNALGRANFNYSTALLGMGPTPTPPTALGCHRGWAGSEKYS